MATAALGCLAASHVAATTVILRNENQPGEKRCQKNEREDAGREEADRAERKPANGSPHHRSGAILLHRVETMRGQTSPTNSLGAGKRAYAVFTVSA
jgi:hypothetical protein